MSLEHFALMLVFTRGKHFFEVLILQTSRILLIVEIDSSKLSDLFAKYVLP